MRELISHSHGATAALEASREMNHHSDSTGDINISRMNDDGDRSSKMNISCVLYIFTREMIWVLSPACQVTA